MPEKYSNLANDVEKYVEKYSSTDPSVGKLSPTRSSISKFENDYPFNEKKLKDDDYFFNQVEDDSKLKDEKILIKENILDNDSDIDFEIKKKNTFLKKLKIFVLKNPLESILIVLIIMLSFVILITYFLNHFVKDNNDLTINIDSIYQTYIKADGEEEKPLITAAINGNTEDDETKQGSIIYDDDTQAYNLDETKNTKPKADHKYLPKVELENEAKAKLSKDKEAAAAAKEYEENELNSNKQMGPIQNPSSEEKSSSNVKDSKQSRLNRMRNWKSSARKNSLKLSSFRKTLGNGKAEKENQADSGDSIVFEPRQEYKKLIAENPVILLTYHGGENIEEKFAEEIEKIRQSYESSPSSIEENQNFETNKNNEINFVPINNDELNIIKHNQNYVLELINDSLSFPESSSPIEINLDENLKHSKNLIDYIFNEQGLGKIHFNEKLDYCQNFPILIINGEPVVNGIKPMVDSFNNGSLLKLIKVKAEGIEIQSKK